MCSSLSTYFGVLRGGRNAGGDLGVRILRVALDRAKVHNEFVERRRSFAHLAISSGVETFAVGSSFSRVDVPHPLWDKWIGHPLSFKVVDALSELAAVCRVCGNILCQAIQRWANCDDRKESQRR